MKRTVIAVILLIITVTTVVFVRYKVNKVCIAQTNELNKSIVLADNNQQDKAKKLIKKSINSKTLSPYIYKDDLDTLSATLLKAYYYLDNNDIKEFKISINECLYLLDSINENQKILFF